MLKKFINLFSGGPKEGEAKPESENKTASQTNIGSLECFVDYVVKILVDNPDKVKIGIKEGESGASTIEISCAKEDMGKVIGKNGKTIMAIRSLVSGAGGRIGKKVSVEIIE